MVSVLFVGVTELLKYLGGVHSVKKMLELYPKSIEVLYLSESNQHLQTFSMLAKSLCVRVEFCEREQLNRWLPGVNHQGVVAAYSNVTNFSLQELVSSSLAKKDLPMLLMLDRVQDPQNLGACIRSAACFGVDGIIIPKDNAAGLTATVLKISVGACALVPVVKVTNLVRSMQFLKKSGFWLYGTTENAPGNIATADVDVPLVWVMGNETKGISHLVMKNCDSLYSIDTDGFSTLNVATSTGICLYQTFSKRRSG